MSLLFILELDVAEATSPLQAFCLDTGVGRTMSDDCN
jgi:hypothetical protein